MSIIARLNEPLTCDYNSYDVDFFIGVCLFLRMIGLLFGYCD